MNEVKVELMDSKGIVNLCMNRQRQTGLVDFVSTLKRG